MASNTLDLLAVIEHARAVLPLADTALPEEYYYASLPLCVVDAVFSIGVRYEGVRAVVNRYCRYMGVQRLRADRAKLPEILEQESIDGFCRRFDDLGLERMVSDVFQNRQRTSTRGGILKAEAVRRFADALRQHGVLYLQDTALAANNSSLEASIREVPGQRSGISLQYFWMLAGSDDFIKPDRMVLRFLETVLGRPVSVLEASQLLIAVAGLLQAEYPRMTPRLLDYAVWEYQRSSP